MKKKNFKILLLIILVCLILLPVIRYKTYNNIEENWIIKISPNYLDQLPNSLYLYKDSYIITNCYRSRPWLNIVHKRGVLTRELSDDLIEKIKQGTTKGSNLFVSVTLKDGEKLYLTLNEEVINEINDIINYDGTIWYAQD